MSLKAPSEDAVAKAFSILMASLSEENGTQFVSSDNNTCEFLPIPQLAHNVDAVWLAKSCLVRKMDLCVARMQHLRNRASPFHQLPLEIFAMILEGFPVWSPSQEMTSIFNLLKVSRGWRNTILDLPQLWTVFPLDIPPNLVPLLLKRARKLPLTITCLSMPVRKYLESGETQEHSQNIDGIETMELLPGPLEVALGEAYRWRKIDFTLSCGLYEIVEELLEVSTPALEALRVSVKYPSASRTMGPFVLGPGPPLKELALYRVCTSWYSPRFTGLIGLELGDTNSGPSINQLLRILSNSPQLEHLSLTDLQPPNYGSSAWSSEPVCLERLETLQVAGSGNKYVAALILSTQFPRCRSVSLRDELPSRLMSDVDEEIWSMGNEQTAAVLGLNMTMAERRRLKILLEVDSINFKNQDSQLQEHFDLAIFRADFEDLLPLIVEFLNTWHPIPDVKLEVAEHVPLRSLLAWSPLLRSLHVKGSDHCRNALVELAKQSSSPGLGTASWMCPGLSEITLEYHKYDAEEYSRDIEPLYFLLDRRWSNTGSDGPLAPQPSSFTWIGRPSGFPYMWTLQAELTEILPSFRMVVE